MKTSLIGLQHGCANVDRLRNKGPELPTHCVVGGDGLIGNHLSNRLARCGVGLIRTTRRRHAPSTELIHADLSAGDFDNVVAAGPKLVFLCAAVTSLSACQTDPEQSFRVNVTSTVELAKRLLACGSFVVFVSSNAVFSCDSKRPDLDDPHSPATEYGRQKAAAENQLRSLSGAQGRVAIVRITKVLSPNSGMASNFLNSLRARENCVAFSDLLMSPISLDYVSDALIAVANARSAGVHHVSGEVELTYSEFAMLLAARMGVDPSHVRTMPSTSSGVDVLFRPQHPALNMTQTTQRLKIAPEPIEHVIDELLQPEDHSA